jgi:Tol biopolymer transport system component
MIRRVILLTLAVLAAAAALAGAAAPEGPRLAIVAQEYGKEVTTIGPLGEDPLQIVHPNHVGPGSRPSWSADGSRLAFTADVYPDDDPVLGVVDADGGNLRIYPRIRLEMGDPVMAPDGRSAAFARVRILKVGKRAYTFRVAIWSFDLEKGATRRLTRWRDEYLIPSSYSPDGSALAASAFDGRRFRAVAINPRGGRTSLLARNAAEPMYAPDGSSFAFVRRKPWDPSGTKEEASSVGELRVGRVGVPVGSRSLVRMRGLLGLPSWDPSGQRLAFMHSKTGDPEDRGPEAGNRVMAINAEGSCLTKVFSDPDLTLYGVAWQPGLGREAGPISC